MQSIIQSIIPKESQNLWKEQETIWSISVNMLQRTHPLEIVRPSGTLLGVPQLCLPGLHRQLHQPEVPNPVVEVCILISRVFF